MVFRQLKSEWRESVTIRTRSADGMDHGLKALMWVFVLVLFARGLDYATGSPHDAGAASELHTSINVWTWGSVCTGLAIYLAIGLATNRMVILTSGAMVAIGLYAVFAYDWTLIAIERGDDWRYAFSYGAAVATWGYFLYESAICKAVLENRKEEANGLRGRPTT